MRQHITVEQLWELTPEQQERLREWWEPKKGDWHYYIKINHTDIISSGFKLDIELYTNHKEDYLPLLSIGQCIELLHGRTLNGEIGLYWSDKFSEWNVFIGGRLDPKKEYSSYRLNPNKEYDGSPSSVLENELIDALWQAVKEVL